MSAISPRISGRTEEAVPHKQETAPIDLDQELEQGAVILQDFNHCIHTICDQTQSVPLDFCKTVFMIVTAPFVFLAECYSLWKHPTRRVESLKNIAMTPVYLVISVFAIALTPLIIANKILNLVSGTVGLLVWHGGERLVRCFNGAPHTVLSNNPETRAIVYESIGVTLLAAAALLIPIPVVQLIALPILLGSLYGFINNQFTVRECPEYYTMGHYYDGKSLKGHAVKTNNLLLKPFVTGCYATTMVTKIAGILLGAAGVIPYTRAILPVPYAAAMIAVVTVVSLVASHVLSYLAKRSIQQKLEAYVALIGMKWTDENRKKTWQELGSEREACIEKKRQELQSKPEELADFNEKLEGLDAKFREEEVPVEYIPGWTASGVRNGVGYFFAGGGTIVVVIATIFLRIFLLR